MAPDLSFRTYFKILLDRWALRNKGNADSIIEDIPTELGNDILETLKRNGWKVRKQYNIFAFDKGVDFDSYTLKKGTDKLHFKWTNWFEWEIKGNPDIIKELADRFDLKIKEDS